LAKKLSQCVLMGHIWRAAVLGGEELG
jgi:hypothetical protein